MFASSLQFPPFLPKKAKKKISTLKLLTFSFQFQFPPFGFSAWKHFWANQERPSELPSFPSLLLSAHRPVDLVLCTMAEATVRCLQFLCQHSTPELPLIRFFSHPLQRNGSFQSHQWLLHCQSPCLILSLCAAGLWAAIQTNGPSPLFEALSPLGPQDRALLLLLLPHWPVLCLLQMPPGSLTAFLFSIRIYFPVILHRPRPLGTVDTDTPQTSISSLNLALNTRLVPHWLLGISTQIPAGFSNINV